MGGGAKICCDIQATYCDVDGYGGCSVYACSSFGAECGTFDDGCGGTKSCGDCSVYGGAKPYCQKGTCVSSCSGQFCGSGVVFQYTSSCGMGSLIQDCSTLGSDSYSSWTCNGNVKERTKTTTDGICNNHANGCVEATVGSNKESVDCSASGQICSGGNCVACTSNCANGLTCTSSSTCASGYCNTGTGKCDTSPSCASTPSWSGVVTNVGSPTIIGQAWVYDDTSPYNACSWRCNSASGYIKGTGDSCVFATYNCGGTAPTTTTGTTKGPSTYSYGYTTTSWTYDTSATTSTSCKWKCDSGYVQSGNGCVPSNTICSSTNCGACDVSSGQCATTSGCDVDSYHPNICISATADCQTPCNPLTTYGCSVVGGEACCTVSGGTGEVRVGIITFQ